MELIDRVKNLLVTAGVLPPKNTENTAQQRAEQEAAARAQAAQQQQTIVEQEAANQPRYPLKKDGTPDFDKMTPQQEYEYSVENDGEEMAQKTAQAYVNRYQSAVDNMQAQLYSVNGTHSIAAMQYRLEETQARLDAWRALLKEQPQQQAPAAETPQPAPAPKADQKPAPQPAEQPAAEPVQEPSLEQEVPQPDAQAEPNRATEMSERFKNPRALFYASMIRKWRNAIQCAETTEKRQQLETELKGRMQWWRSSIYNSVCDQELSAKYAAVFEKLETEDFTEAERRATEMRAANLKMLYKQEQGEMYKYAMNLLRKAEEYSDLECLVAEIMMDAIEDLRKKGLEMLIMPRLRKINGVSDITINSGVSVRPSDKGEVMELIQEVEAMVAPNAEADFLYAVETVADHLNPDRFSICTDELIAKTHNNKRIWEKTELDPQFTELRYGMDDGVTVRFVFERETKNTLRFKELVDDEFDIPKMSTIYVNKSLLKKIGYSPLDTLYITLQHNG